MISSDMSVSIWLAEVSEDPDIVAGVELLAFSWSSEACEEAVDDIKAEDVYIG